ncbi:MAG: CoA-binding protein [Polyangiaceae bacterium]|nr:CoA-binding protein [Polyangiaceae bacterium]
MHPNIIDNAAAITALIQNTKRIAVLGIKTEAASDQPAYYVPKYALDRGYDIVPIPVYYPEATHILGRKVYRSVAEAAREVGPIDMVDVFRRPKDLASHADDILAAKPKSVWLQLGIEDNAFATRLANAGITVVQNRCLMVELRQRHANGTGQPNR